MEHEADSKAIIILGRALAENGLTWEDIKENVPPFANSIGIAFDRAEEGGSGGGSSFPSVTAFALAVCRRFGLLRNEKALFLSSEDSANTAAILLAKERGIGIEDVLVSDVYDILRQIRSSKASPDANLTQDAIVESYCSRLKTSNLVDCRDIVKIIGEALEDAERRDGVSAFLRDFLGSCAILVGASDPKVSAEVELLRLMLKASSVKATLLRPETSLDSSLVGAHKFSLVSDTIDMEAVDCNDNGDPSLALVSSTEEYCTRWAEGYLRLLVNSRDELAIARILCGPFGVLDEAAFKIIRREAGKTKMPIYQTLVSYVNKFKLGGKSYAPGPEHPFYPFNKGLCEFVDLTDKLQARMEEEKTEEAAARRILGTLKSHALKSGRLKLAGVESSFERLGRVCEAAVRTTLGGPEEAATPKRDVGSGGSLAGRSNMKMIRGCLDRLAAAVVTADVHKMLGKVGEREGEAGKTPVSAPRVTSLFKTPETEANAEEVAADVIETEGLGERLGLGADKGEEKEAKGSKITAGMPKFGSTLAWAMESSPAVLRSSEKDPAMGAVAVDLSKTPVSSAKTPVEDEEETAAMFEKVDEATGIAKAAVREAKESRPALKRGRTKPKRSILRDINNIKAPPEGVVEGEKGGDGKGEKKRKLTTFPDGDASSKPKIRKCDTKEGKPPKTKSAARTKKPPPLIKGQTKMTAFFRL